MGLLLARCTASGHISDAVPPAMAAAEPVQAPVSTESPAKHSPLRLPDGLLVAHALGGIGGLPYTNSLDALRCNYARGFRWFEVDLALTKDGELVCFHPGNEQMAGLQAPVAQLPVNEVEGQKYGGRYPIPRFSELLRESDALGDVVLVTDTKGWPPPMLDAVRRALQQPRQRPTRVVFQSYGEHDLEKVSALGREVGASVILTLYMSPADDVRVEALAKQFNTLAVVADTRRFTPWLAERLHAARVPLLVHTVNDHREILSFIRAGADGFYTDAYRPYEGSARDPAVATDCDAPLEPGAARAQWTGRDVFRPGDYVVQPCVHRTAAGLDLAGCDDRAAIIGPFIAVPPRHSVRVVLEVEADADGSEFWFEVLQKNGAGVLRGRERMALKAREVRRVEQVFDLPTGSGGLDARVGLGAIGDGLVVRAMSAAVLPEVVANASASAAPAPPH